MIRTKYLQIMLFLLTAVLATVVCMKYIPEKLEQQAIDRLVVSRLVDDSGRRAVWLDGSVRLSFDTAPVNKECTVKWTSGNPEVASVTDDGVVTGHAVGTAVITATADSGATLDIEMHVIRKALPPGSDLPANYDDELMIANGHTSIGDYTPEDLRGIPSSLKVNKPGMKMTGETLEAYSRLAKDTLAATGQPLMVISGYRSYATQKRLYDEDVAAYMSRGYSREKAQELTERSTNKPGCSEHQLGNTIDIGTGPALQYNFNKTKAGAWVHEHAHEYGFILRYPADKVDKTTIDYEAWHFRYVGVEHATYIYEHGLCLEEYIELMDEARQAADEYSKTITATQYLRTVAAQ